MQDDLYTGKKIALFTDAHALLEPVEAIIDDAHKKGITEIYSLGDNIGVGPNPSEVLDLLEKNNVISIAGNSEYYVTLGIEPFASYFTSPKKESHMWTMSQLNEKQIGDLKLFPSWKEIILGGKRLALCHFANDVRIDYTRHSTWSYQNKTNYGEPGYEQFLYTNSKAQEREINSYQGSNPSYQGYVSVKKDPLFGGDTIDKFDAIFQGHVHFKVYETDDQTDYYSIRAAGIGYGKDPKNMASYAIINEKANGGFDFEEVLVPYNRNKMLSSIYNSDSPDETIKKFTM